LVFTDSFSSLLLRYSFAFPVGCFSRTKAVRSRMSGRRVEKKKKDSKQSHQFTSQLERTAIKVRRQLLTKKMESVLGFLSVLRKGRAGGRGSLMQLLQSRRMHTRPVDTSKVLVF